MPGLDACSVPAGARRPLWDAPEGRIFARIQGLSNDPITV